MNMNRQSQAKSQAKSQAFRRSGSDLDAMKAEESRISELTQTVAHLKQEISHLENKNLDKMRDLQDKLDYLCSNIKPSASHEAPPSHPRGLYGGHHGGQYGGHHGGQYGGHRGGQYGDQYGSQYGDQYGSQYGSGYRPRMSRRQVTRQRNVLNSALCLVDELDYESLTRLHLQLRGQMADLQM